MPYSRKTPDQLINQVLADIKTELQGSNPYLRRTLLRGIGQAQAGVAHGLHGHLAWLAKQIIPSVDNDIESLDMHASKWLKGGRKSASYASGSAQITGTDGMTITTDTQLQADGVIYTVQSDVIIAAGVAQLSVIAVESGKAGNLAEDVTLTLLNSISGVNNEAVVIAPGVTGGADVESNADLFTRLVFRIQNPPAGGAAHDYIAWALEIPGVTRAWCYPLWLGLGTVGVCFMMDDVYTAGIPQAADVATVLAHIDTVRPVTAKQISVFAPIAVPLNFEIRLTPNTSLVQQAAEAELADLLRREAVPECGNGSGTLLLSHLDEAISLTAGETDHELLSPTTDVARTAGQITTLGSITWS